MNKILIIILGLLSTSLHAQIIDKSFGTNGLTTVALTLGGSRVSVQVVDMASQSTGKTVVLGTMNDGTYSAATLVMRLDTNGQIDEAFGYKAIMNSDWAFWDAGSVVIDKYDRIVFTVNVQYGDLTKGFVALFRLTSDGTFDNSFSGSGQSNFGFLGSVHTRCKGVVVQDNGNIILSAGSDICESCVDMNLLVRFTDEGSLDTTYVDVENGFKGFRAMNFGNFEESRYLYQLKDGSLIQSFTSTAIGGGKTGKLVKYTGEGKIDSTFGTDGIIVVGTAGNSVFWHNWFLNGIVELSDGRIVVGGNYSYNDQEANQTGLVMCFTSDGQPDVNFGNKGSVEIPSFSINDIELLPGDRILTAGNYDITHAAVLQLLSNGAFDPNYGNGLINLELFGKNISTILKSNRNVPLVGGMMEDGPYHNGVISRFTTTYSALSRLPVFDSKASISIYPNPASDIIHVASSEALTSIEIKDLHGKTVFTKSDFRNNVDALDVTGLRPGIYIISVNQHSEKVIIK